MRLDLLLIEDSDGDRILITEFLKTAGFDVVDEMICSEQELKQALAQKSWDVIVCDHIMPGFSSFRALEVLHQSAQEIPLLVVSGMIDDKVAIDSLNAGAFDYVMKDNLARLPSAIQNAMTAYELIRKEKFANDELKASRLMLRRLGAHIQNTREEERGRFARDLHDDLGSGMAALKMDLKWLTKRLTGTDDVINDKLSGMTALVDSAIASVRQVISEMRPSMIDDLGLMATIEWQLEEFGNRYNVVVELDRNCDEFNFNDKDCNISVYRIFQEALNNIAKHAAAKSVVVKVLDEGDCFTLDIVDDGKGFEVDGRTNNDSFGIISMSERALVMDGVMEVCSTPGKGTRVKLTVPIEEKDRNED